MEQDRIQFANILSDESFSNMAKEICITQYFNELMAFYDLINLDQSSEHEGIKKFWFENGGHDIAMNIEFGTIYLYIGLTSYNYLIDQMNFLNIGNSSLN